MNQADEKSIFGVLVALAAIFILWLWASGNAAALWYAISGAAASSPVATGAAAAATNGSSGASLAASVTPTPSSQVSTVTVPNYASNVQANGFSINSLLNAAQGGTAPSYYGIQLPNPESIGGNTLNGAVSGGVSVTPTVFSQSTSVPAYTSTTQSSDWLSELLGLTPSSVAPSSDNGLSAAAIANPITGISDTAGTTNAANG